MENNQSLNTPHVFFKPKTTNTKESKQIEFGMKVENNTLFDIENYSNDVKTTNIKPPRTALKVTRAIENCNIQNSNNSTYTKIVSQTESIEVTLINNVYININEQWKIKGFINLYSRNGFVYFDYIPIKSIIVNDSLISKEEKKIFNINEYKCVFCFRDISSIQVMYSKTHQIISKTIYTIIFEPKIYYHLQFQNLNLKN
ncbi:hypothetical protein QTN25_010276 [Entamoeba marina]